MKRFTSNQILAMLDLYELQDTFCNSGISFTYVMTPEELRWLDYVSGKYGIADWINERLSANVLTFDDNFSLTDILIEDGIDNKAVMLSDETALQKLFFWLS